MKNTLPLTALALLALSTINLRLSTAFAQGSLTPPPGAPAPTMKSLDQIEARSPVDATHTPGAGTNLFLISQPGAYYLTGNITISSGNAITIVTNGVTLDLNGFTISSTNPTAENAILLSGGSVENITILNGHVQGGVKYMFGTFSGTGFKNGITTITPFGANPRNVRVSGVTVSGCASSGINIGAFGSTSTERCNVYATGGSSGVASPGISAGTVSDCAVDACNGTAINCLIAANSTGTSVSSGVGILARSALNCVGTSATGTGLNAIVATGSFGESTGIGSGTGVTALTANGCYGSADGSTGAGVSADTAAGCRGYSSAGVGISAGTANGCYAVSGSSTANALQATFVVANSYGSAPSSGVGGRGITGPIVSSSYGQSAGGSGVSGTSTLNCFGIVNNGFAGIEGDLVQNCWGENHGNGSSRGILANVAQNSFGQCTNGIGVDAFIASICSGDALTRFAVIHNINSY